MNRVLTIEYEEFEDIGTKVLTVLEEKYEL